MIADAAAPADDRIAVNAADAAAMFSCCERHWRSLDIEGKLPVPLRLGRSVRWRRSELDAWAAAGCPDRATWETIKEP